MPLERNETNKRAEKETPAVEGTTDVKQHSVRDDISNHGTSAFGRADPFRGEDGKTTETPASGDTAGKKKPGRGPRDVSDKKFDLGKP